ncbi:5-methylcytosine-specific restriction endonuclease McrA [Actinokineospora baliensis]|nr:5-methylcytosine-specific restriction endonuclease McrA [Actinokineospora baliensis]
MDVDHVVPLRDGGLDVPDNVRALCRPCHAVKTAEENAVRVLASGC